MAPALGVSVHHRRPLTDRLSLVGDHVLYGSVLSRLVSGSGGDR